MALYQFCVVDIGAETVDRPRVKACRLFFMLRSDIFNWSWSFSINLASCGRTDISCLKSTSLGLLATGGISACLYWLGYLHCFILAVTILWTTGARSSLKRWSIQAGILPTPVAFLGFRCFREFLTCPIDGNGGAVFLSN